MNTYIVTRWTTMPTITVKADNYTFESVFVNFYLGTIRIESFQANTVMRIQKQ